MEVTEAYLERIEALNPKLNSYITVMADEAITAAQEAETAIASGGYLGPMHGVPVAIKDQFLTKGILTTAGSNMLRDYIPKEDATVVTRLKEAGAVIIGKTNLTEFAITTNHYYPHGMMYNPWDMGLFRRFFQRGVGVGYRFLYVRHVVGRRHGWFRPRAGGSVRSGGLSQHLRTGESIRASGGLLV